MRKPRKEVRERMQEHMAQIMDDLGLDATKEPGLLETPRRFVDYLLEFAQPLRIKEVLGNGFDVDSTGSHSMVVQTNIPFRMICEHHLLPAIGRAALGYVPNATVVGLSKLTRLVQAVGTERPSIQEAICDRIANLLDEHLEPKGAIVVLRAEHTCMACRGVNAPGIFTTTSAVRGVFRDVPQARSEFFSLIRADQR
ncbi:hypothetical protein LCGC14_1257640 [marine sediment metagenome]|uniref:GTP cyclohydrolase I n=1 Tax=marine sediment metagenome TaxID=412755 RepID=A0A0F9NIA7_9ZZZZ